MCDAQNFTRILDHHLEAFWVVVLQMDILKASIFRTIIV